MTKMTKLEKLNTLHKETELNFHITSEWDAGYKAYFQSYYKMPWDYKDGINPRLWKYNEIFETLDECIDWLITKFEE